MTPELNPVNFHSERAEHVRSPDPQRRSIQFHREEDVAPHRRRQYDNGSDSDYNERRMTAQELQRRRAQIGYYRNNDTSHEVAIPVPQTPMTRQLMRDRISIENEQMRKNWNISCSSASPEAIKYFTIVGFSVVALAFCITQIIRDVPERAVYFNFISMIFGIFIQTPSMEGGDRSRGQGRRQDVSIADEHENNQVGHMGATVAGPSTPWNARRRL